MPIPFSELDFRVLLHHQGAYECIDRKGHQLFVDWDMSEFVKSVFGEGTCRFLFDERAPDLKSDFDEMEKAMPFLKYGESGQHYGYELFIVPPDKWQYRGEPFWWAYQQQDSSTMNSALKGIVAGVMMASISAVLTFLGF